MLGTGGRTARNLVCNKHSAVEGREIAPAAFCGRNAAKPGILKEAEYSPAAPGEP